MENKTALITGGTSGLGLSMVKSLLQQEYQVFFIGSNIEKGVSIELALNQQYDGLAKFVHLDLSRVLDVKDFARKFLQEQDRLDILANIAGVLMPERLTTQEGNEYTFAIGYLSAFLLSTSLAPMLEKAKGRIVNVAAEPFFVLKANLDFDNLSFSKKYGSTKVMVATLHAKTVLTQILSDQYASKGIDVISFYPGMVRSGLTKNMKGFTRWIYKLLVVFMPDESKMGNHVISAMDIKGISGKLFYKKKVINLNFGEPYRQRLWDTTVKLVNPAAVI